MKLITAFLTVCGCLAAQSPQAPNPTQRLAPTENEARMAAGSMPIYRITVIERTTKAVNYNHRSGATKIDFQGTLLLPKARGEAKVESKQGYIEIEVANLMLFSPPLHTGPSTSPTCCGPSPPKAAHPTSAKSS